MLWPALSIYLIYLSIYLFIHPCVGYSFSTQHIQRSCSLSLYPCIFLDQFTLRVLQSGCCYLVGTEEHKILRQNICCQDDLLGRGITVSYCFSLTCLPIKRWEHHKYWFLSTLPWEIGAHGANKYCPFKFFLSRINIFLWPFSLLPYALVLAVSFPKLQVCKGRNHPYCLKNLPEQCLLCGWCWMCKGRAWALPFNVQTMFSPLSERPGQQLCLINLHRKNFCLQAACSVFTLSQSLVLFFFFF